MRPTRCRATGPRRIGAGARSTPATFCGRRNSTGPWKVEGAVALRESAPWRVGRSIEEYLAEARGPRHTTRWLGDFSLPEDIKRARERARGTGPPAPARPRATGRALFEPEVRLPPRPRATGRALFEPEVRLPPRPRATGRALFEPVSMPHVGRRPGPYSTTDVPHSRERMPTKREFQRDTSAFAPLRGPGREVVPHGRFKGGIQREGRELVHVPDTPRDLVPVQPRGTSAGWSTRAMPERSQAIIRRAEERDDPRMQRERDVPEARRKREDKRVALRSRGREEQMARRRLEAERAIPLPGTQALVPSAKRSRVMDIEPVQAQAVPRERADAPIPESRAMLPMQTIPLPERPDPKLQRERDVPIARRKREDKRVALRSRGREEQMARRRLEAERGTIPLPGTQAVVPYAPNLMQQAGRVPGPKDLARSQSVQRADDDLAGFVDVPPGGFPDAPRAQAQAGFQDYEMKFKPPVEEDLSGFEDVPAGGFPVDTPAMEEEKRAVPVEKKTPAATVPVVEPSFEEQLLRETEPVHAPAPRREIPGVHFRQYGGPGEIPGVHFRQFGGDPADVGPFAGMVGNEPQDLQSRVMTKLHTATEPGFGKVRGRRGRQGPYPRASGMPRTQAYTSWDKAEQEAAKTYGAQVHTTRFARGKPIHVPDVSPVVPSGHRVGDDDAFQPVDPASLKRPETTPLPDYVPGESAEPGYHREPGYRFDEAGAGWDEPTSWGAKRAEPETADLGPDAKRQDTGFHFAGAGDFGGINLNDLGLRPRAHDHAAASFMDNVRSKMADMPAHQADILGHNAASAAALARPTVANQTDLDMIGSHEATAPMPAFTFDEALADTAAMGKVGTLPAALAQPQVDVAPETLAATAADTPVPPQPEALVRPPQPSADTMPLPANLPAKPAAEDQAPAVMPVEATAPPPQEAEKPLQSSSSASFVPMPERPTLQPSQSSTSVRVPKAKPAAAAGPAPAAAAAYRRAIPNFGPAMSAGAPNSQSVNVSAPATASAPVSSGQASGVASGQAASAAAREIARVLAESKKKAPKRKSGISSARKRYTDARKTKLAALRSHRDKLIREHNTKTKKLPKKERDAARREFKKKVNSQYKEQVKKYPPARGMKDVDRARFWRTLLLS